MIARFAARLATRRPLLLAGAFVLIALAAALSIGPRPPFDADILNLLPQDEPAVAGLRKYAENFGQARELAFVVTGDGAGRTAEDVAAMLKGEQWVARVLSPGIPAPEPGVLLPLLLNLPVEKFPGVLGELEPAALGARIGRLAEAVRAGSPAAAFELATDPLGIGRAALAPLFQSGDPSGMSGGLVAADDSLAVIACLPREAGATPGLTMQNVDGFLARAREALPGLRIGVTGHAPFAAQIEAGMKRDITLTTAVSLACVAGLFWLGYRRLGPLAGIAIFLGFSALVSTAIGVGIFGELNAVAVGFCSILFGLGDDFSLLVCQRFEDARARGDGREAAIASAIHGAAPGILWVALTTAVGFLALGFAGSAGLRQLGVLVAVGVVVAALAMLAGLPLFLRGNQARKAGGGFFESVGGLAIRRPWFGLGLAALVFLPAIVVALWPWRVPGFDLTPASLEPTGIPAARALAAMREKLPDYSEPTLVILENPDPGRLTALDETLRLLQSEGLLAGHSSPTALVLQPARIEANRALLGGFDLRATRAAFQKAASQNGLSPVVVDAALRMLDALASPPAANTWNLPEQSPWHFLIERATGPDAACAYLRLPPGAGPEARKQIADRIAEVPGAIATGWSQTLVALAPRAARELAVFGGIVLAVIGSILMFAYRDLRLWMIHLAALAGAAALTVSLMKFAGLRPGILNVLAFPLLLGAGVDYGTHILLAAKEPANPSAEIAGVLKPVTISALTTIAGFGALAFASSPALSGLGIFCAAGIAGALLSAILIVAPLATLLAANRGARQNGFRSSAA